MNIHVYIDYSNGGSYISDMDPRYDIYVWYMYTYMIYMCMICTFICIYVWYIYMYMIYMYGIHTRIYRQF
jgi:hypothetical protein